MDYTNITRILSAVVIIIGLVVMIGWFIDDDALKRLNPNWVTMKFSTATSFLASGLVVLLLNESRNRNLEAAKILIFAPLIIVLFFMATLLVSTIAGTSTGVSSLFVTEDLSSTLQSVKPGTPSVGTMVNFLLIIGVGFTYLLVHPKHKKYSNICGAIVLALALTALVGYAIDSPPLYYQIEGASGAMALHTTIAFALLGIGMILFVRPEYIERGITKKSRSLSISLKLISAFLISALFPIIVLGFISFDLAETSLEKEIAVAINEQADLYVDRIDAFFFERKADVAVTSKLDLFKREFGTLNQFYNDPTNIQYIESDEETDERLRIIRDSYGYDNIMLVNPEGTIVFVSNNERKSLFLGKSFLDIDPDTFLEGKKGVYLSDTIPDLDADGLPQLFTSHPILDEGKNLLGVLVFDIPVKRFLDSIIQQSYIGETGETLVVKKAGDKVAMLSSLRFPPSIELTMDEMMKEVHGPAYKATSGLDGTGYDLDYRGEEVIVAWRYLPSLDWGLVSKIDTVEAFAPIFQLQQDITILGIVFIIGIGFFGVAASRTISNPILKLKDLAVRISKGELGAKVLVQSTDEIGQLSEMMNETSQKLKVAQKAKQEFLAMITHELKTPLTPIQGFCEMLKDPDMGELNEDQKEAVDEIYNNSEELLHLIGNVLTAQKIEINELKFNIQEIGVDEFIEGRHRSLLPLMVEKGIKFVNSTEKGLVANGDNKKLNEVFANLVQNSIDFVPDKNGRIEIGAKSRDKDVLFYVKDNGKGIPKDKIKNMFKKFYQIDSSYTRKHGGSGLGLSICKGYIEGLGGKMWVESEPNVETTFYFTLAKMPQKASLEEYEKDYVSRHRTKKGKKITELKEVRN